MSDPVRINNNQHSWSSVIFKAGGDRYTGVTAISYSDKRERVKAYGMGRHHAPRGRSAGKYSTDPVKATMWKASAQILREVLAELAVDGISYGDVEFDITIQYIEPGEIPITVEIERCVFSANSAADEENPDPLKEDVEFDCMLIRRNGKVLFDSSRGAP